MKNIVPVYMSYILHEIFEKICYLVIFIIVCFIPFSCKKLIEVDAPYTSLNAKNVFEDDATAAAVLSGIYGQLSSTNRNSFTFNNYLSNITFFSGLSSDELVLYDVNNSSLLPFYLNSLNSSNAPYYWDNIYPLIFTTNSCISALTNNIVLTNVVRKQLLGEAQFIRAFSYFYLVNMYGGVPLVLQTDPSINASLSRNTVDEVYKQIIIDLEDAKDNLNENFLNGNLKSITTERVRPTKWAAIALLARVYAYREDFTKVDSLTTTLINQSSLFALNDLDNVFLKNSKESIWQLQCVTNTMGNTGEGQTFVLPKDGTDILGSYPVYLSKYIVNSFEPGDLRKEKWIDSINTDQGIIYYSYKYKSGNLTPDNSVTEYLVVLRLAEIYLLRAEAKAQSGDIAGAQSDLNTIRHRSGLKETNANTKTALLSAVIEERKKELFLEWGHRWFDLKRSKTINDVMAKITPDKGGTWSPDWQYYPLNNYLLKSDPNLIQNDGY